MLRRKRDRKTFIINELHRMHVTFLKPFYPLFSLKKGFSKIPWYRQRSLIYNACVMCMTEVLGNIHSILLIVHRNAYILVFR